MPSFRQLFALTFVMVPPWTAELPVPEPTPSKYTPRIVPLVWLALLPSSFKSRMVIPVPLPPVVVLVMALILALKLFGIVIRVPALVPGVAVPTPAKVVSFGTDIAASMV